MVNSKSARWLVAIFVLVLYATGVMAQSLVVGTSAIATTEDLYGFKFRAFKNTSPNGMFGGVPSFDVVDNRQALDMVWTAGNNKFEMVYDPPSDNIYMFVTNGNDSTFLLEYFSFKSFVASKKTNPVFKGDVLNITVKATDPGVTVGLRDVKIGGIRVGPFNNTAGSKTWSFSQFSFAGGWSLEGNVFIDGTFSDNAESCFIEIMVGVRDTNAVIDTTTVRKPVRIGGCPSVIPTASYASHQNIVSPTFAPFSGIQSYVVGLRTDGLPGIWELTPDCKLQDVDDMVGGFPFPEATNLPRSYGWNYSITDVSKDGKWIVGCATMNNTNALDGNANGFRNTSNNATSLATIDIPNGTTVALRWNVRPDAQGRVDVFGAEYLGDQKQAPAIGGGVIVTSSSAAFCPTAVINDAHGDYIVTNAGMKYLVENTSGGNYVFYTQAGNVWDRRMYNVQGAEPTTCQYLTQVLETTMFGPKRVLGNCGQYAVGIAVGVARNGEIGMWQIRHDRTANTIRLESLALNSNSEQMREFSNVLSRRNGWTYRIDPGTTSFYNDRTGWGKINAFAFNERGSTAAPYSKEFPVIAGTRVNISQDFFLNPCPGYNCGTLGVWRRVECGKLTFVPRTRAVMKCEDGAAYTEGAQITEGEVPVGQFGNAEISETPRVVPNPSNGMTYVENVDALEPATSSRIINVLGQAATVEVLNNNGLLQFDAANLTAGTYFVEVHTANSVRHIPFIVR